MNCKELVREVAKNTGFTIKDVTPVVENVFDTIANTVVGGEDIKIQGFGSFTTTVRAPRTVTSPTTREVINIPETKNMKFSPSTTIKNAYRA